MVEVPLRYWMNLGEVPLANFKLEVSVSFFLADVPIQRSTESTLNVLGEGLAAGERGVRSESPGKQLLAGGHMSVVQGGVALLHMHDTL